MPQVPVELPDDRYEVTVEPGVLDRAGEMARTLTAADKACLVTDANVVAAGHAARVRRSLESTGFTVVQVAMTPGEAHKTLAAVSAIYDAALPVSIDRRTPVLALGGGVVGDVAGFAAATLLRGLPLIQLPTTLLSMVDASVGGKTGVDHPAGKNLIGAFHQPKAVLADPEALRTLPLDTLRDGLAECIKHDMIRDAAHFDRLGEAIDRALSLDVPALTELVTHNVRIKAGVVAADPLERGDRAHLNFGHTFAHAIELVSNFSVSHGRAVAVGMVAACRTAEAMRMLDSASTDRLAAVIARAGLPTRLSIALDPEQLIAAMSRDKKAVGARVRFVLPDRIGHVVLRDDVPEAVVRQALKSVCP